MAAITGTSWPTAGGPAGVDLLLDTLAAVDESVTIITVRGLDQLADAYRRDPDLFHAKIERVVVFAGDPADRAPVEYNVALDPVAFVTVMSSGLPIRWVPSFDGGLWQAGTRSSFVQTDQAALLPASLPDPVERFLSYRLAAATTDPLSWVRQPVTAADRHLLESGLRNVWAAGLLDGSVAGGVFEPTTVRFNARGQVDPAGTVVVKLDRWRVTDPAVFRAAMIDETVAAMSAVGRSDWSRPN